MKNDKLCFSKTLGYLVMLVLVVAGFFYVMSNVNKTSTSTDTQAGTTCNATQAAFDNGCERLPLKTDVLSNGTSSQATPEYSGRRCIDVNAASTPPVYQWVEDKTICQPTYRCNYGSKIYIRDHKTSAYDYTDSTIRTVSGTKCIGTTGIACKKYTNGQYYSTSDSNCGPAVTNSCNWGTYTNITDISTPAKWVQVDGHVGGADAKIKCIQVSSKNVGARCKTDLAGVINATGSITDTVNCPVPQTYTCYWGGQDLITNLTQPFKWVTSSVGGVVYKCIVNASGVKQGVRCITDTNGNLNGNGSKQDLVNCPLPGAVYTCSYGGYSVTATSSPYKWVNTTGSGATYKCIQKDGKNVGARCRTTSAGLLNGNNSVLDSVNCPVTVATCTVGTGTCGWGGETLNYGDCRNDSYGGSYVCECDATRTSLTYPVLVQKANVCP